MSGNALLERIDTYVQMIRERHPPTADEVRELDAYFRVGITYTSNALEDNSLTFSETRVLLEGGITMGDKPVRGCYEATGHARAYDHMLETARGGSLQSREKGILRPHALFYNGIDPEHAGRYWEGQVLITGVERVPPTAEEVPDLMAGPVEELNKRGDAMHPVLLAAYAHRRLVDVHPFQGGNGRTTRLPMNLILVNGGYYMVSIPPILRHNYITALQQAQWTQDPSDTVFIRLICKYELEAQKDYCRMFRIKFPERREDTPER